MGRSPKVGLDYFPMDVHMDDKMELIEAQFGLKGFAVVVKLWQRIYAEHGYYCEWNEDIALVFASKQSGLNASAVSDIICAAIKRELFDKDLFEEYGILTSRGIQKRYFEAVGRREQVEIIQEYLLVPRGILPKSVNIKGISADINSFSANGNTQSKVNKSKGDKSKREYSHCLHTDIEANPYGCQDDDDRPDFNTIEAYASSNLRNLTPGNIERFQSFIGELPEPLIRYAIDKACGLGHPFYGYVEPILQQYVEMRFSTVADIEAYERQRRTQKGGMRGGEYRGNSSEAPRRIAGETIV